MTYISEKYQLGVLAPYLKNNFQRYVTEGEVYSIPIDILAMRNDDVYAIELKSRNHKKGIIQAQRNEAFADYSYLATWRDQVSKNLLEKMDDTSIGLIAVDANVEVIQEGRKLEPNPFAKEESLEAIKKDV